MRLLPMVREGVGFIPLRRQMNRLLSDFFEEVNGFPTLGENWPVLDLVETPEAVLVKVEVPGVDIKDLDISVIGDTLTIKGEKHEEKEEKGKTWHRVERSYGAFTRTIPLPVPVKTDRVEATSKDGVLTITLPKSEEAKPKHVVIKT